MKKLFFYLCVLIFQFLNAQEDNVSHVKNYPIPIFTDSNLSLVILVSAWDKLPNSGDEISIIDANWNVVGTSKVLSGNNGMAIWGDNPKTIVKDGLLKGEKYKLVLWNSVKDEYRAYKDFKLGNGTEGYIKDGFTVIESLGKSKKIDRITDVYYHVKSVLSDNTLFSFYTTIEGVYQLKVFRDGELVFETKSMNYDRGYYSFEFFENLVAGKYVVNLVSENKLISTKSFNL